MHLLNLPYYSNNRVRMRFLNVRQIGNRAPRTIDSNDGYFRFRLLNFQFDRSVVLSTELKPIFHSIVTNGLSRDRYEVIFDAQQAIPGLGTRASHIATGYKFLTPILPFKGQPVGLAAGLFSSPVRDLVAEMLELMNMMSLINPALNTVFQIADLLHKGTSSLLGLNSTELNMGCVSDFGGSGSLSEKIILIADREIIQAGNSLRIIGRELYKGSEYISNDKYIILHLEVGKRNQYWSQLPEIAPAYLMWRNALFRDDVPEVLITELKNNLLQKLSDSSNLVTGHLRSLSDFLHEKSQNYLENRQLRLDRQDPAESVEGQGFYSEDTEITLEVDGLLPDE